ncbi:aldo/keto reductase [Candidatus Xianfuyuplasma coldseepsis]|uniref:Aldo/keto reductase n=1 Tax=Candidatus Xianfuyuplasma coldseepsis TaxID=2782163 RepID=A0A7L7KW39_9MOLU|nr:aldo/keto reductase [Xianfuyuplasma coldseepsis]QMS85968.1 aldo/keto reductase [Xianfuyuplasma coldseepsis]
MKTFTLANGVSIPAIGLGTWKSREEDAYQATLWALEAGYRHIDTAQIYGNEEQVGRAIKDSKVPREDIFVTTKLWNTSQGYESTKKAFQHSLDAMELEYVDLYLIHWFKGYEKGLASWRAMEELYNEGKIRAIGVSNHNVHHLMNLIEHATIKPMVNQVETHVELQNEFLRSYCAEHDIVLEAYAPFMSWRVDELIQNETLQEIAEKYQKTVPQVTLKWLEQRGIVALPKSVNKERILANFDVHDFSLEDSDMERIKGLNKGNKMFPEFDNVMF